MNNKITNAQKICNEAVVYMNKNSYGQALDYLDKVEPIFSQENNVAWLTYLYHQKFICYFRLEKTDEAINIAQEVMQKYREKNNKKGMISFLVVYSELWQKNNNLSQSLHYIKIAEAMSLLNKESSYLALIYLRLARIFSEYKFYVKSLSYYQKALDKFKEDEKLYQAQCWEEKGIVYQKIFRIEEALEALQKSAKISLDIKETDMAIRNLENIRKVHLDLGEVEKARKIETQIVRLGTIALKEKVN